MKMLSIAMLAMLTAVAVAQDKPRWVPGWNEEVLKTKKLELYGSPGTITAPGGITVEGNVTGADVISTDDVIAGDDMVVGDDLTVTDRVTCADAVVTDDLIVGDDATVAGDLVVTGGVTAASITADASNLTWTVVAAVNVTNGQAVTLSAGRINILRGTGQADGLTNTITIANFAAGDVGKITYVANAYNATNVVTIVETGNFYGDTIALKAGDSMAIYAGATNILYGK